MFDIICKFYINASKNYVTQNIPDAVNFFTETETLHNAFEKFEKEEINEKLYLISDLLNAFPELLDFYCKLYVEDRLCSPDLFEEYAERWKRNPEVFEKCSYVIHMKTGNVLETPKQPIDYEGIKRKDIQCFFNSLFNADLLCELLKSLLVFLGRPEMTVEELRNTSHLSREYPKGTWHLRTAIIHSEFSKERVADFFELIDMEDFVISRISHVFNITKGTNHIEISEEQQVAMKEIYSRIEDSLDLHNAFKEMDNGRFSWMNNLKIYMTIKNCLNFQSPSWFYQGLIEIPYFVIDVKNVSEKYDMIENYLEHEQVTSKILAMLPFEKRVLVLSDIFHGCKRYQITAGKATAVSFCVDNSISSTNRQDALDYLYEIFGLKIIVENIMNFVDESFFENIVSILKEENSDELNKEMLTRYEKNPRFFILKNMINNDMPEGLVIYNEESKKMKKPMDSESGIEEVTRAISGITQIKVIPLLLDSVRLLFSNDFTDSTYFTLYNSLLSAFRNCAQINFETVHFEIKKLQDEMISNIECVGFCSLLLDDIIKSNKDKLINKLSENEVVELLERIK